MRAIGGKTGNHGRRPAGAAVEMAVLLPIVMLLILGCIDFGRFAYDYIALSNAARTGAGFGSIHPHTSATSGNWQAQVRQAIIDEMK